MSGEHFLWNLEEDSLISTLSQIVDLQNRHGPGHVG